MPLAEAENGGDAEELDLTNSHLSDTAFQTVELKESLTDLTLTANRLKELDERILALPRLRSLCLRQNLLTSAAAIDRLTSATVLRHLSLQDNQLQELPQVARLTALTQLEVSYNQIRSIASLTDFRGTALQQFYAASNKISQIEMKSTVKLCPSSNIPREKEGNPNCGALHTDCMCMARSTEEEGLSRLPDLRVLELGCNRIRRIEGVAMLSRLEELWLGRNRISRIEGLGSLAALRRLSLQSNRLESMRGVGECPNLAELYLSHNNISQMEDLDGLTQLEILDISNNSISEIRGLASLTRLKDLWLNDNRIASLARLGSDLAAQRDSLACIYLEGNPGAAALAGDYRQRLKQMLPALEQIDADMV